MKKKKWILTVMIVVLAGMTSVTALAKENTAKKTISIIFSHDMHSHLEPENMNKKGEEQGGFAKMDTVIKTIRDKYPDSFLLDGGDFSMGTPYQAIFSTDAAELRMMKVLGFDVSTFGNHEFDYGPEGLAQMMDIAGKRHHTGLVCANLDWDKTLKDSKKQKGVKKLKAS